MEGELVIIIIVQMHLTIDNIIERILEKCFLPSCSISFVRRILLSLTFPLK